MKTAAMLTIGALIAGCSANPAPLTGKGLTVTARADKSYGACRVSVGDRAYRLNDDLGALRGDMRERFGDRMHLWSTEVRLQALNFEAGDCGARALAGLHRAGFVKFTLVPADQRAEVVAPVPPAAPAQR